MGRPPKSATIAAATANPGPGPARLSGTDQEKIRRQVLLGATARELADTFGISFSNAHHYVRRWQQELQAVRQDEREVARGILLNLHDKAQEMFEMAKAMTTPPPAAPASPAGANERDGAFLAPPKPPEPIPAPDFEAMASALSLMADCAQKLGEFSRSIGTTGVAQIRAASEENIELAKQEFAINHPDRIPGLGFQPNGFGGNLPPGTQIMQAIVMPKSAEGERAERARLGLPEPAG